AWGEQHATPSEFDAGLDASDWPGATPSGKCQGLMAGVECSMIGPETLQGPVRWPSCALQPAMPAATAHCPEAFREVSRHLIHTSEKASRFSCGGSCTATEKTYPMNWTEGNLARHSRGGRGKELLQRQKQHFAKVRSGYFNNHKDSPRSLRDEVRSPAQHLSRYGQRPEPPVLTEADRGQKRPRSSQRQFRDPPGVTTEAEHLNLTSFDLSPMHVQGSAAKRLRLLNKRDWTGVEVQKWAQPQPSQREQNVYSIAQSRKEYHRPRPRVPIRHILGERYDALIKGKRLSCRTPSKPDSIRIRVGSQDMRIGGSSVTVRPISEKRDATSSTHHSSRHLTNKGYFGSSSPLESRSIRGRHARSSSEHSTSTTLYGGKTYLRRGVKRGADSSSPSSRILQPVPCRMHNIILDPLLRSCSPNSDADDSLIAQIGRARPVVLPELQEENNKWVQLMCPSDSGLSIDALQSHKLAGLNVSPGVSADGFKPTSSGQPPMEARVCEGEFQDLVTSQPTGAPEKNEPSIAVRIGPKPVLRPISASVSREEQQPSALLEYRETVPDLALGPAIDPQRSLVNDRKSEYDAWIKSFLSSEDSDTSFNQQALHDARLDAVQVMQCSRLKKAPSAEDSHEGLIFRNTLGTAASTVRAAASHVATDGSIYSSVASGPLPLDSAYESRECQPSTSIQVSRSISADSSDSGPENHEWKHDGPSFSNKLDCLASESHSAQGTFDHKELEVIRDASIRGNAAASTTHAAQESMIRGPASVYNISSVVAEPAQSSSSDGHSSAFRFAAPKLFVGKHATRPVSMTSKSGIVATGRGRKGRSRGDKLRKESHRRTNIRQLPNHDGDPIEEFSDEIDLIVCPKSPPLFKSLQTE
ncbi:hypothetical protein PpBr36_07363, partial [Pyricularia pennisetigena]|uniref:hypothetical protein n=1 Tax=Pyricularia pennisetigena TaxID=1578925 RepID=UPI001150A2E3